MATPACTLCNEETGLMMVTTLTDGDTIVVGGSCLPSYALSVAAGVAAEMTPEAVEAHGELFDQIAKCDTRHKTQPATTAAGRKRKATSAGVAGSATPVQPSGGTDTATPHSEPSSWQGDALTAHGEPTTPADDTGLDPESGYPRGSDADAAYHQELAELQGSE